MSEEYPHLRRNFVAFAGDYVLFLVAMAFANNTSVIPSLVSRLTDYAPLIGLVTTISNGVWLLPQLIAANYVANKERKKPFVIRLALIGRPMYLLVALVIFVTGNAYPELILTLFFFAATVFTVTDGLTIVAWLDILGKTIPPLRRGRLYSTGQIAGGLLAFAAGFVVSQVLGPRGPGFPYNYGVLLLLSSAFLFLSLTSFSLLEEPAQEVRKEREPWKFYMPRLGALLRQDQEFRLVNVVRLLAGLGQLATPFYVVYAMDVLQLGDENIGFFVSAQVVGGIVASFTMGYLNERSGSRIVTQLAIAFGLGAPLLALFIHICTPPGAIVSFIYAMVFFLIGANWSGYMQGFMNIVLEMAPADERPAYVGLYNTLGGTLMVVPLLGGWLLQNTSYPVLYGAAAIGLVTSLVLSFKLAEPRRKPSPPVDKDCQARVGDV
jgi:MFS family permease